MCKERDIKQHNSSLESLRNRIKLMEEEEFIIQVEIGGNGDEE